MIKPRIVFEIDYTTKEDKQQPHVTKIQKRPKKAYCSSQACAPLEREGETVYSVVKKNATKNEFWCPDCGFALFWQ